MHELTGIQTSTDCGAFVFVQVTHNRNFAVYSSDHWKFNFIAQTEELTNTD